MSQAAEWNRRGVLARQQGDLAGAAECYERALRLEPALAEAHFNLGLLRRDLGRVDLAIQSLEATAALRPDIPIVQLELVQLYLAESRWAEAEARLLPLAAANPGDPDIGMLLAWSRQQLGKLADAAADYRRVLEHSPRHAVALTNLGTVLNRQNKLTEAIACFQQAIESDPALVEAHANLGNAWLQTGQFSEAYLEFQLAAELRPDHPRTQIDLGNALHRLEKIPEALQAYERAAQLDPQASEVWLNLSHLFKELGDFERSRGAAAELARRDPSDPWQAWRVAATCPLVFPSRAAIDEYRTELQQAAERLANVEPPFEFARWTMFAPECPYNLQFLEGNLRPWKSLFAAVYTDALAGWGIEPPQSPRRSRPRIGWVVTAKHETAFLKLISGVVNRLDRRRWELVVFCSQTGHDRVRQGIDAEIAVVGFPERFDSIVQTIREAACDLLYYWEVGNDPTNYFLPFLRLAPTQVTSWGIQVTTGIPNMDYYLSSDLVEPADADEHYSEQLIRSTTLLTYQTPLRRPTGSLSHASFGLSDRQHLYGCVQNLGKFHPDFDPVLAEILRRDPQGVIVGVRDHNGHAARILQERWRREMPDVADRIRLLDPLAAGPYAELLNRCDVLLDPLHFGGVTTTYDALALHQPVVTLPTPYHRGRYTAACLRKVGVTGTIAQDIADYVNLAVRLGSDGQFRESIKEALRQQAAVAFEDGEAIREHERILEELLAARR